MNLFRGLPDYLQESRHGNHLDANLWMKNEVVGYIYTQCNIQP